MYIYILHIHLQGDVNAVDKHLRNENSSMDTCNFYTSNRGYEVLGETLTDLLAPCGKLREEAMRRSLREG